MNDWILHESVVLKVSTYSFVMHVIRKVTWEHYTWTHWSLYTCLSGSYLVKNSYTQAELI